MPRKQLDQHQSRNETADMSAERNAATGSRRSERTQQLTRKPDTEDENRRQS